MATSGQHVGTWPPRCSHVHAQAHAPEHLQQHLRHQLQHLQALPPQRPERSAPSLAVFPDCSRCFCTPICEVRYPNDCFIK
ncbi:hypothetical protein FOCC_FOCC001537, partial [Frankliniella occidentalis]